MHFLFVGAIVPSSTPGAACSSTDCLAVRGASGVEGLGRCWEELLETKAKQPFCKVLWSVPL